MNFILSFSFKKDNKLQLLKKQETRENHSNIKLINHCYLKNGETSEKKWYPLWWYRGEESTEFSFNEKKCFIIKFQSSNQLLRWRALYDNIHRRSYYMWLNFVFNRWGLILIVFIDYFEMYITLKQCRHNVYTLHIQCYR